MTYEELALDRHQAQRLENNRAIKLAALALAEQNGLGNYTVEQLATAANVSRRTFFNHFGSIHEATRAGLRDILLEASESVIAEIEENVRPENAQTLPLIFESMAATLSGIDFTPVITKMCSVLGFHHLDPESSSWFSEVFSGIVSELRDLLAKRAPGVSQIGLHLLIENLLATVRVTAETWLDQSQGLAPVEATALWHKLHNEAISQIRHGFAN